MDDLRQATRLDAIGGRFDPWLLGVSIALACMGVVMVGSAAIAGGGVDAGPWYFLSRHLMFLAVGLGLAVLIGVVVGLLPALRAMRLKIVDALAGR